MDKRIRAGLFVKRTQCFFFPYLGLLALLGIVLLATDKGALHLALNRISIPGSDSFFSLVTYLGDRRLAWFAGAALLLRRHFRKGAAMLIAGIGTGLSIQGLKHGIFGPLPRPVTFFGEPSPLRLVAGFENHLEYTMPSGHAALAFAFFTTLALQTKVRWEQATFFGLACLAAYSRVYLSEHFLEDVYAGSVLGVAFALLVYALVRPPYENAPEDG
jgi:membrane-associated phospholipid phosphatase